MSNSTIIFYDLVGNKPGCCWSTNTWKTRLTLNYKGIPYKTEWLDLPDIEGKCKEMGIPPTKAKPDGSGPLFTLPAIWDPLTKTGVSDSYRIAQYLDKTYSDTPPVLFDGIENYDHIINGSYNLPEFKSFGPVMSYLVYDLLSPVGREYYKSTREAWAGKTWDELLPTAQEKQDAWNNLRRGYDIYDSFLQKNKAPTEGEQLSYLDIALGGTLYGFRQILGEDSEFWRELLTWNEGRWGKYVEKVEKYTKSGNGTN